MAILLIRYVNTGEICHEFVNFNLNQIYWVSILDFYFNKLPCVDERTLETVFTILNIMKCRFAKYYAWILYIYHFILHLGSSETLRNIALNRKAWTVNNDSEDPPHNAVDGNRTSFTNISGDFPFLAIDLGGIFSINKIKLAIYEGKANVRPTLNYH